MNDYKLSSGSGGLSKRGCSKIDDKLHTFDWLADLPESDAECNLVEVQFKNTRKGYYQNSNNLELSKGDIVAVEASPGHDIGTVTLTGRLVPLQMRKNRCKPDMEIRRIYRKAKPVDMEKYNEAKSREHSTMIRARQIALDLKLEMKIGDVEYQGDGNKAIFYYIADERVDFRQLIKVLAEVFRVRIEMKQIGARQEAGRIGGIGPCGRELCCATWMTTFVSVSTSAARYQDISLNPQKLAGQCAKLKCCLNYEVDCYVEAQKRLPSKEIQLETKDGLFYYFKADILSNQITYSTDKSIPANLVTISSRRAFEVIGMNKRGIKPDSLHEEANRNDSKKSTDLLEQESLTRFDRNRKAKGNNNAEAKEAGENNGGGNSRKKKKKGNANRQPDNAQQAAAPAKQQPARAQNAEQTEAVAAKQPAKQPNNGEAGENNKRQSGENKRKNGRNNRPKQQQEAASQPQQGNAPQGEKAPKAEKQPAGGERPQQQPRKNQPKEKNQQGERKQQGDKPRQEAKPQQEPKPRQEAKPTQSNNEQPSQN